MRHEDMGFPEPAGFDDEPRRARHAVTPARLLAVVLLVVGVGLIAVAVENGEGLLEGLANNIRLPARQNKELQIQHRLRQHLREGNIDKALEDCDEFAKLHPKEGEFTKANILTSAGRLKETIPIYTKIIAIDPADATAYNNRAYNRLLMQAELDEAEQDIARAIEIRGDDEPSFIDTRGYLHYLRGRLKPALADFNKAIRLCHLNGPVLTDAGIGEVYFHRGLTYREMGEVALAEKDFAKSRALGFRADDFPRPIAAQADPGKKEAKEAAPPREVPVQPDKQAVKKA